VSNKHLGRRGSTDHLHQIVHAKHIVTLCFTGVI